MKITIRRILSVILIFALLFTLANMILYCAVETICEDTIEKPFRYESQGLFGTLTKIETTEQNKDGYTKFCIKHGEPSFWSISENINYLIKTSQNNS